MFKSYNLCIDISMNKINGHITNNYMLEYIARLFTITKSKILKEKTYLPLSELRPSLSISLCCFVGHLQLK